MTNRTCGLSDGISRRHALARMVSVVAGLMVHTTEARPRQVSVRLETGMGSIDVVVECSQAPITSADFLKYVDRRLFEGGAMYRTVRPDNDPGPIKIDVIQGGVTDENKFLPKIPHEPTSVTGLRHRDGTVSVGRNAPGTGTAGAFFICIGDQPELDFGGRRNPDGQGFAAFARVVSGMEVVREIWKQKTEGSLGSAGAQVIAPPVPILSAHRCNC